LETDLVLEAKVPFLMVEASRTFLSPRGRKQVLPRYFKWRQIFLKNYLAVRACFSFDAQKTP
jgi:hypothetical protein